MFEKYNHILELIVNDFKIDFFGDHGIKHWESVFKHSQILANHYEISSKVFELFALLHDSKREDEYQDINHGLRASVFVKELLVNDLIKLNKQDAERLIFACANHTVKNKTNPLCDDLIVQICFDSDKLDLGRVWMTPDKNRMYTSYAKYLCI